MSFIQDRFARLITVLALVLLLPGCLLIRITDHRIKLNKNGSGEGFIRLVDIRTDALSDSAAEGDFATLMAAFDKDSITAFEREGRKVTKKQLLVHGDSLIAEISYTFPSLDALEGIRMKIDELFFVVDKDREVIRTNGKVTSWENDTNRIVWARNAQRLQYVIREKALPPSRSLAPLYVKYSRTRP